MAERLDVLEGRVEEQSRNWDRVHAQIRQVDQKIDDVARDLSSRIVALDRKLDRKIDDLRRELSRQFRWTMGTMIALLGTMLTLGAGVITALLTRPAL